MKIGIAALAAISLGSAAFAGTVDNPFGKDSAVLSLAGLNLATAEGQQRRDNLVSTLGVLERRARSESEAA